MIEERQLIELVAQKLSSYFEIYLEFKGKFEYWNPNRTVSLDIGCFPKAHLIKEGFPKYFFGIEVKCFNLDKENGDEYAKTFNLINQGISYKYSKFGNKHIEPAFILIADNLNVDNFKEEFSRERFVEFIRFSIPLRNFAAHQNIGRLVLRDDEISFLMPGTFWHTKSGFRHKEFLNFYCGNRDMENRFKKVLLPYEHI